MFKSVCEINIPSGIFYNIATVVFSKLESHGESCMSLQEGTAQPCRADLMRSKS